MPSASPSTPDEPNFERELPMKFWVRTLMLLYLVGLIALQLWIAADRGDSWWVSLVLFSPRWVWGLPWLILFPWTLLTSFRLAGWYVLHALILLLLVMDLRIPWSVPTASTDAAACVRLITCNLGEGPIREADLLSLVRHQRADVLVVQESAPKLSGRLFAALGWDYQQRANLAIGSRWPQDALELLNGETQDGSQPVVSIAVTLKIPGVDEQGRQPVAARIVAVHFPTFRPAFERALRMDQSGQDEFRKLADDYRTLARQTLTAIEERTLPTLVAGDFNVPVESTFYRDYWSGFQNALSQRGAGLCYTKFTRFHGIRIDHVLADEHWQPRQAAVGPPLGGDHRPVFAEWSLRGRTPAP